MSDKDQNAATGGFAVKDLDRNDSTVEAALTP